jgi:hypothetical protein
MEGQHKNRTIKGHVLETPNNQDPLMIWDLKKAVLTAIEEFCES